VRQGLLAKHPNEGMKRFRTCSVDQPFLLPPSLQDWLPDKHLARFIAEVVDTLDLAPSTPSTGAKTIAALSPTIR